MKRAIVWIVGLLVALVLLEGVARFLVPPALVEEDVWRTEGPFQSLRPGQDGARLGASWRTDEEGWRRDGAQRSRQETGFRLLVLGGRFTAAEGLDEEECYTAVLEREIRQRSDQKDAVVVASVLHGPVAGRLQTWLELIDEVRPHRVLLQVETRDPARERPHVFAPAPAPPEPASGPGLASLRLARWWQERAAREEREAATRASLSRDGISARPTRNARTRSQRILEVATGDLEDADRALFDELLRGTFDTGREQEHRETAAAYRSFLDELKRRGCVVAMLQVGPPSLTEAEADSAALHGVPRTPGPCLWLDPELRGVGCPTAAAHEVTARTLFALLAPLGFFGQGAEVPETQTTEAQLLDGVLSRYRGHEADFLREARDRVQPRLDFVSDAYPYGLLGGMGEHGRFQEGVPAAVVAWPGHIVEGVLDVTLRYPTGVEVPDLEIRWQGTEQVFASPTSVRTEAEHQVARYTFAEPETAYMDTHRPLEILPPPGVRAETVQLMELDWREL